MEEEISYTAHFDGGVASFGGEVEVGACPAVRGVAISKRAFGKTYVSIVTCTEKAQVRDSKGEVIYSDMHEKNHLPWSRRSSLFKHRY
jgi:hypothetical protein